MLDNEPCSENLCSSVDSVDSAASLPSLMSLALPDLPIPSLITRGKGEGQRVRIVLVAPSSADASLRLVRPVDSFLTSPSNRVVSPVPMMPCFYPGNRLK